MSSAAIVSRRMRDSANATSSAIAGSRWWHTISMSRCSSTVLIVYGIVGLVDDGSTLGSPHALMMSGAWPPPAPSVWNVPIARPAIASSVVSTNPDSLMVSVWIVDLHVVLVRDLQAIVDRRRRRAPVLVELQAVCAGLQLLGKRARRRAIALAHEAEVHRKRLGRLEHAVDVPGSRRARRRKRAGRRSGAAAHHRRDAGHQRFVDLLRADVVDVRVDAARGDDHAFAGDDLGAGADHDVDAGLHVRVACLAELRDPAVLDRDVALDDAPPVDHERVGDHRVRHVLRQALALSHAVAYDLAAAELDLFAVRREITLDLDDEIGVGEAHAIARASGRTSPHRRAVRSSPASASSPIASRAHPAVPSPRRETRRRSRSPA